MSELEVHHSIISRCFGMEDDELLCLIKKHKDKIYKATRKYVEIVIEQSMRNNISEECAFLTEEQSYVLAILVFPSEQIQSIMLEIAEEFYTSNEELYGMNLSSQDNSSYLKLLRKDELISSICRMRTEIERMQEMKENADYNLALILEQIKNRYTDILTIVNE